ncbi:MAG: PEP/pyruvate-binding domain-containing protein [Verrucomicrobiota bacterium]
MGSQLMMRWLLASLFALSIKAAGLGIQGPDDLGWFHIQSPGASNQVQILERSLDLGEWTEAGLFHDGPFDHAQPTPLIDGTRYFRLRMRPRTTADDGRNQFAVEADPFTVPSHASMAEPGVGWVKFTLVLGDEPRVWFQDSNTYPFHHEFARLRLPAFQGMSREEFDRRTLRQEGQIAVLGAVLLPGQTPSEIGIQLVGQEAYPIEDVVRWLRIVRAAIRAPGGLRTLYVPTYEQSGTAEVGRARLTSAGFEPATADRWVTGDAVYNEGWALGRLNFIPATEIDAAYAQGRLLPTDILLTDRIPAEIPFVAGVVSLTPSTPNSHVAILAQGWEIPVVWLADPDRRQALRGMAGRDIAIRTDRLFSSSVVMVDVTDRLGSGLREELLATKRLQPLNSIPKRSIGLIATNVQELRPDAVAFVGGKAANYGLLRRTIPGNCDPAIALTFDLWDAYLEQTVSGGRTLRAEIESRLSSIPQPPDVGRLRPILEGIRDLIRDTAVFTAEQQTAILEALVQGGFDPGRKLRFRSSTNVEDGETFSGAGLYDSYSGCLQDDLDGDATGPSACDPSEPSERGVFRAIRKVYASFYNENAYLERLRRGVRENEVGMGVLVHVSYPDESEWANGVATLSWEKSGSFESLNGTLVSQVGAESITNPNSTARPEVVDFYRSFGSTSVALRERSGRVPLGGTVMTWESDYRQLVQLLGIVVKGYSVQYPKRTAFRLDFEYKKIAQGKLVVKQVRRLPDVDSTPVIAFLLPGELLLAVEEGEHSDVFAKHRLKSDLRVAVEAVRLTDATLAKTFYSDGRIAIRIGGVPTVLTDGIATWPGFSHLWSAGTSETRDRWTMGEGPLQRDLTLITGVTRSMKPPTAPWIRLEDCRFRLEATYAQPQPTLGWEGPGTTQTDAVFLVPRPMVGPGALPQERRIQKGASIRITTRFWWPPEPTGPTAGYTAPNIGFTETRIEGWTSEPLVLRDAAAQTYSPGHHNFTETFLFEPRLDPATTAAQRKELETAGIQQILVDLGFEEAQIWLVDAMGRLRKGP